ncbi:MAG TPA: NAD-dependent DNA ligase LigA, partial [Longimicrobiales bacterium]|nr:NAD-dependent DNA ligase LigA [Longimicrobiales bacterium]
MARSTAGRARPRSRGNVRSRIAALRAEIARHDRLYYELDRPEISDAAYDRLTARLRQLERQHPELVTPESPTQRVAGAPSAVFRRVRHAAPMLSLESTSDPDVVSRFDERVGRSDAERRYLLQPKLDGLSVELVYERGALVCAATRGDGAEGEDVTANARVVKSIPRTCSGARLPRRLALRGEIVMRVSAFERLNRSLLARGEEPFANPRNAAAGSMRQLDPQVTAGRALEFIAYEILAPANRFTTDGAATRALRSWGFRTPRPTATARAVAEILDFSPAQEAARDSLQYEIDGVVIKVDDLAVRRELGSTAHHPRWALAFKFAPRAEETRVEDIVVQVGRTGVVTPVALLRPVEVGGVTVARATLHNAAELARKDIRVGDLVRVHRAGDVIPEITGLVPNGRRRGSRYQMPKRCPGCGSTLVARGPITICPNAFHCPAQLEGRLTHFASRDALDIAGVGRSTARELVRADLVRAPADLFRLTPAELMRLPHF